MTLISDYIFRRPNSAAKYRIFYFPYAGAGASSGEAFYKKFAPKIDFIALQFPGRENRIAEQPIVEITRLVDEIAMAVLPHLDMPFVFWGHCSGALIAFEVANKIRETFNIQPHAFIVSACAAPQFVHTIFKEKFHNLPDKQFFAKVLLFMENASFGNSDSSAAVKILLPGIKADFTLYENYRYNINMPFDCPVYAFGGKNDKVISKENLLQWKNQTTKKFESFFLENQHHYFVNNCADELANMIKELIC